MKNRLGFFGGCFNPVTNAHIDLIKEVIEKEKLDKVYFVPMGDLYNKDDLIDFVHRNKMLQIAIANEDKMDILDISNKNQKTSAIDTFKIIDEKFANSERFFIMGSDNYKKISTWKDSSSLIQNYNYIVLDRENKNTKDISSSIVRKKIKQNEKFENLVPMQIISYIKQNNLYK